MQILSNTIVLLEKCQLLFTPCMSDYRSVQFSFFWMGVLGLKRRALCLLGRYSTNELRPQPLNLFINGLDLKIWQPLTYSAD